MFRKSLISLIVAGFVIFVGNIAIFAQTLPVSGTVELLKADGTRVPVEGALVEVFRTDVNASSPPAKTGKKGDFSFAGLQPGWTFILSISAPGAAPTYLPNVRAGQERLLITMTPGDGTKVSEAEVRAEAAKPRTAGGAQNTEEMKKAQAEYEAKVKEVEEKNKKATETNQIVTAALKTGNEAFAAKNYDVAIAKYDEGIAADPNFVGSAPIFYNNRGVALRTRGVDTYNLGIKAADVTQKIENMKRAKKDFADASTGYLNSWNVLKAAPAADITDRATYEANKLGTLRGAIEVFQMAVRTEQVDPAVIEAAKILISEYQAVESDAAKKAAASLTFADLYRIAEDRESAIAGYKKVLEASPDNIDALAYVGIVLVDLGWIKDNDKALSQEGANYLQKFVSVAPDTHKLKSGAAEYLEILKAQSIIPVKAASAPAPRRKP